MFGTRTPQGFEVRLRPRGPGRYAKAAFLSLFLCAWAAGEVVAPYGLYGIARSVVTGDRSNLDMPDSTALEIAICVALLGWIAGWTIGGVFVLRELLRIMWGEDCIVMRPDRITIRRRLGPFVTRHELPRERVRSAYLRPKNLALAIETDSGVLVASDLGFATERGKALEALHREAAIPRSTKTDVDAIAAGEPPTGWKEVTTREGDVVLVRNAITRRTKTWITAGFALCAIVVALMLISEALHEPTRIRGAILACAIAIGLTFAASWLVCGRWEWRIGSGTLTLRVRLGSWVRVVFVASSLELRPGANRRGDVWFSLDARSKDVTATGLVMTLAQILSRDCLCVAWTSDDPTVPRRLGQWLSRRADLPFEDLASGSPLTNRGGLAAFDVSTPS